MTKLMKATMAVVVRVVESEIAGVLAAAAGGLLLVACHARKEETILVMQAVNAMVSFAVLIR